MISLIVQFTKSFDFAVLYPMIEIMGFTTEAITFAAKSLNCLQKSLLNYRVFRGFGYTWRLLFLERKGH